MNSVLTAEMLLREIYLAETELRWVEQKYGLLSETFYQLYEQGRLRDEDPAEIQPYLHLKTIKIDFEKSKWSAPARPVIGVGQGADQFCMCPAQHALSAGRKRLRRLSNRAREAVATLVFRCCTLNEGQQRAVGH